MRLQTQNGLLRVGQGFDGIVDARNKQHNKLFLYDSSVTAIYTLYDVQTRGLVQALTVS